LGTPDWVDLPIRAPAHRAIVLPDGTTRELGKEKKMATMKDLMGSMISMLLAVGFVIALVFLYAADAKANSRPEPGSPGYTEDNPTYPYITQVSPGYDATGVARNSNLKVTFSEPMDPATVTGTTFRLYRGNYDSAQSTPATVSRDTSDASGRTWVLDPYGSDAGRLDANTQYMVRVTPDVRDLDDGAYMTSDKTWYFTTAAASAPYVTQVSPTNGATGVARNSNLKVTFSEPMDPTSINTSTLQLRY
jgi:hypothetical protein